MRPIDADALKITLSDFNYTMVQRIVDEEPTIEIESVKHGQWIYCGWKSTRTDVYMTALVFECSECGHEISVTDTDLPLCNYCQNCGSKNGRKYGT